VEKKIALLGVEDSEARLSALHEVLSGEIEISRIKKDIRTRVKSRIDRNQRDFVLREQLKEINRQLGDSKEGKNARGDEFDELHKAIEEKNPPPEVLEKAKKELGRLRKLQSFSPEAGVLRTYLEWIADLPWNCPHQLTTEGTEDTEKIGIAEAEAMLNSDHYAMEKAKERILEFIAVYKLSGEKVRGPILCFQGPPGTGKTSLGRSVARALGREFVRISLGGVRDEAEIRGHRKTYVGALPGKIIQSMKRAGAHNPVFLLDEIDKLASDGLRGDPAAALLEVLDPEQNNTFTDHYLEVPYDLSHVLFIATANSLHNVPYPLLDRMEVIEIPGYSEGEKLEIGKRFLVPKILAESGFGENKTTDSTDNTPPLPPPASGEGEALLPPPPAGGERRGGIQFTDDAITEIIRYRTSESGVRGLERELSHCVRKIAKQSLENGETPAQNEVILNQVKIQELLGRRKYNFGKTLGPQRAGVSYGLAWTETGGAVLTIETVSFPGKGELILTGNLGDVLKESATLALSYIRQRAEAGDFDFSKKDFHIHVPEGAVPKDGPSAGLAISVSILSAILGRPPLPVAMTGELTLTGRVLPIGGLKEKLLAAIRERLSSVILPEDNMDEWAELPGEIKNALHTSFVENAEDAYAILFPEKGTTD
jgi:ATP-dependent Lon protease